MSDELKDEQGEFYVNVISPIEPEEEGDEKTNTYQTRPTTDVSPRQILQISEKILEERLKDKKNDAAAMKKESPEIAHLIREEVKRLRLDRYKIIVHVAIAEKCDQDIVMSCSYLCDADLDHHVAAKYVTADFAAKALIFLFYNQ